MYSGFAEDDYHDNVDYDAGEDSCSEVDEEELEVRLYGLLHFDTNPAYSETGNISKGDTDNVNNKESVTLNAKNSQILSQLDNDSNSCKKSQPQESSKDSVPELSDYLIKRNGSSASTISEISSLDDVQVISVKSLKKPSGTANHNLPTLKGSVTIEVDSDETRSESSCIVLDSTVTVDDSSESDTTLCDSSTSDSDDSSDVACEVARLTSKGDPSQEYISLLSEEEGAHDDIKLHVVRGRQLQQKENEENSQTKTSEACLVTRSDDTEGIDIEDPKCTLEDIHNSLGECDWSIHPRDVPVLGRLTNRYYRPISVRCNNCNEQGHLSKVCPQPKKIPACLLCGERGHLWKSCPSSLCYNCYQSGHTGKDCDQPRRKNWKECKTCKMPGHKNNECPNRWRQFHLTTSSNHFVKGDNTENGYVYCSNCGHEGHFNHDCLEDTMDKRNRPTWPFITRYKLQHEYEELLRYQKEYDAHQAEAGELPRKKQKDRIIDGYDDQYDYQNQPKWKKKSNKGQKKRKRNELYNEEYEGEVYDNRSKKQKRKDTYHQPEKRAKYDDYLSVEPERRGGGGRTKSVKSHGIDSSHSFVQTALKAEISNNKKSKNKKKKPGQKENFNVTVKDNDSRKVNMHGKGNKKQYSVETDTKRKNKTKRGKRGGRKNREKAELSEMVDQVERDAYYNKGYSMDSRNPRTQQRNKTHYGHEETQSHRGKYRQQNTGYNQQHHLRNHTGTKKWNNSRKGAQSFQSRRGFIASGNY